jgi:hypothetical protein
LRPLHLYTLGRVSAKAGRAAPRSQGSIISWSALVSPIAAKASLPVRSSGGGTERSSGKSSASRKAARSLGLAARFASGYLAVPLDHPEEPMTGAARGSTHAVARPPQLRQSHFRLVYRGTSTHCLTPVVCSVHAPLTKIRRRRLRNRSRKCPGHATLTER